MSTALRKAQRDVQSYHDEIVRLSHEAIDCRDCEDCLRMGLEALAWIERAEDAARCATIAGNLEYAQQLEADEVISAEYAAWLHHSQNAEPWINVQLERGHRPENLDAFRDACERVREIVEQNAWAKKSRAARKITDADALA